MEDIKMNVEEIEQITILVSIIELPEKQPVTSEVSGCKGCEGGCAAELCAF